MLVIPKGAKHNITNKGTGPLKLFTVYSPAAEYAGIAHKNKAEAEAAEADQIAPPSRTLHAFKSII